MYWKLISFKEPDCLSSGQILPAFYETPFFFAVFTRATQNFIPRRVDPVRITTFQAFKANFSKILYQPFWFSELYFPEYIM
jgi:hypothetical protein